jgi:hypothetical protein
VEVTMSRMLSAGVVLLFAILMLPTDSFAQQTGERTQSRLGQNYPNPFNPETRIPYEILEEDLVQGKAVVTIVIRNALMQVVAVPLALEHPDGRVTVENLEHTAAGWKVAYWDGRDRFGHKVASAPYWAELVINGRRVGRRTLVVAK